MLGMVIAMAAAVVVGMGVAAVRAFSDRHVTVARAIAKQAHVDRRGARRQRRDDRGQGDQRRPEINAPFTRSSCVHFRVAVVGPTPRTESDVLHEEGAGVMFIVEDDSGRAIVSAEGAVASLAKDPVALAVVVHNGYAVSAIDKGEIEDKDLRFFEGRLTAGERVAVRGIARWEPDPDGERTSNYREQPKRLRLTEPIYISDRFFD